jgi:cytochrome P450
MTTPSRSSEQSEHSEQQFPMPRRCPFAPPAEYEQLRASGGPAPARLPNGSHALLVTRHADAEKVYSDVRFTTDSSTPGFPSFVPPQEQAAVRAALDAAREGLFIDLDPPEHDYYRRMLISEFGVRRINQLRPRIQQTADSLIDDLERAGRSADLVSSFGLPLSSLVICELLGVPYADHAFFQSCTRRMLAQMTDPSSAQDAQRARVEIRSFLSDLAKKAERAPGDDLIGRLVVQQVRTGALTHEALVGMLVLLLVAGHETTANMIPLGVLALIEHPDQLQALRADPTGWPGAVEELLRYLSIVDWAGGDRMAIEDLDLSGTQVRAGDGVYVLNAAANHDENAFEHPEQLDLGRDARHHLAFGYGVHQCLGQNLARAELQIAYRTLFERLPRLRPVKPLDELPFKYGAPIFGLHELPVTW